MIFSIITELYEKVRLVFYFNNFFKLYSFIRYFTDGVQRKTKIR